MKMRLLPATRKLLILVAVISLIPASVSAIKKYSDPAAVNIRIEQLRQSSPALVKVHKLAVTPGGREMLMIEIGKHGSNVPAVLVGANMSGTVPVSTEAALSLASRIAANDSLTEKLTWYIVPVGNPDAYARYFNNPLWSDPGNDTPFNDDTDDLTDEDGFNDLDGNGVITMMRAKACDGVWLPVEGEPRLMRKADPSRGEKGIYRLYTEGIDDDGDGEYNEDAPGGTNVDINFPHLFRYFGRRSGLYPGSAPESFAIMKFAFDHPELAMVFSFGSSNYLLSPPRKDRKGSFDSNNIRVPQDAARMLGIDGSRTYSMDEIRELVQPMLPSGMTADESMLAGFLGLGAVVNPLPDDMAFYNEISSDYKEYLKKKGVTEERLDPAQPEDGSFDLWAYYQLGLPVFSMDIWGLPKPENEKKEEDRPKPDGPGKMPAPKDKNNMGDPKEIAMLAYSDKCLDGKGFIPWKEYDHPTLGKVEIGGFVPFTGNTPPPEMVDSLLNLQLPYMLGLVNRLPDLKLEKVSVAEKGGGVYQLEVWITNKGYLPFPTAMGKRNKVPVPAIITVEGNNIDILSGKKRTPVSDVGGMKSVRYIWLVRTNKKDTATIRLESKQAGGDVKQITIGG